MQKPWTLQEVRNVCKANGTADDARMCEITQELNDGFSVVENMNKVVSFFGSKQIKEDDRLYQKAQNLAGRLVSEQGYTVVTGGGPGIMEAANRGAFEAGGKSVGFTIELEAHHQKPNQYLTDQVDFHYFFARKVMLAFAARLYIVFPGGFGTMDEFFELVTLKQEHKIPQIPIVCVGSHFWRPMERVLRTTFLEDFGTIVPSDLDIFQIIDDEDDILELATSLPKRHTTSAK
jgi:uncharacterized protein (TIGR00730 family)